MPFANDCGLIVRFLQFLRDGPLLGVERVAVCLEAIDVAVLSSQDGSSAGTADGIADKAVFKKDAFGSNLVDIRCDVMFFDELLHP